MTRDEIKKELWDSLSQTKPEISSTDIFGLVLFVMIVGFVFGFMVGVSN